MTSRNPYLSHVAQTPEYSTSAASFDNDNTNTNTNGNSTTRTSQHSTGTTLPVNTIPVPVPAPVHRAGQSSSELAVSSTHPSQNDHNVNDGLHSKNTPSLKSSTSFLSTHKEALGHKVQPNGHRREDEERAIANTGRGEDEPALMIMTDTDTDSDSDDEDHDYDPLHPRVLHARTRKARMIKTVRRRVHRAVDAVRGVTSANTGLLLVLASQAFFSIMNTTVKVLNGIDPPMGPLQLVWVRMVITYICCITYMLSAGVPDPFLGPKGVRILLLCRGFFGYFGLFGIYYSLQYLTLSDATVLTFLSPITTGIAGALLLGEGFTKRQAIAGFISLAGVVLIARPAALFGRSDRADPGEKGTSSERMVAVGVALVGVLGATGAYTSIRAIGTRAHAMHSMTFFSLACVAVSSLSMLFAPSAPPIVIPTRPLWLALLLMIGLVGFIAQLLLTMGLQKETAGRGALAIYSQIVFASIFQMIFFDEVMGAWSIVGTVMIVGAAGWVALSKKTPQKMTKKSSRTPLHTLPDEEEGLLNNERRSDDDHR